MSKSDLRRNAKLLFAAYLFLNYTEDLDEIVGILDLERSMLDRYMQSRKWKQSLKFWGIPKQKNNDFGLAEKLWNVMIGNGTLPDIASTGGRIDIKDILGLEGVHDSN